jgi:hypothetical protein
LGPHPELPFGPEEVTSVDAGISPTAVFVEEIERSADASLGVREKLEDSLIFSFILRS